MPFEKESKLRVNEIPYTSGKIIANNCLLNTEGYVAQTFCPTIQNYFQHLFTSAECCLTLNNSNGLIPYPDSLN